MGTYSVNYRNEPVPLRVAPVASPVTNTPESTDLAFAYASIKRRDPDLNVQPTFFAIDAALRKFIAAGKPAAQIVQAFADAGVTLTNTSQIVAAPPPNTAGWLVVDPNAAGTDFTVYAIRDPGLPLENLYVFTEVPFSPRVFPPPVVPLSAKPEDGGVTGYDPFTPIMRAYANDRVQVRALAGAHMDEHSFLIHGVNYRFEPSYTNSGFQTTQAISLSEHFEMEFRMPARSKPIRRTTSPTISTHRPPTARDKPADRGASSAPSTVPKGDLGKKGSPVYLEPLDEDSPEIHRAGDDRLRGSL